MSIFTKATEFSIKLHGKTWYAVKQEQQRITTHIIALIAVTVIALSKVIKYILWWLHADRLIRIANALQSGSSLKLIQLVNSKHAEDNKDQSDHPSCIG